MQDVAQKDMKKNMRVPR